MESLRGVRSQVSVPRDVRERRTLDERMLIRFPSLARVLRLAWAHLPPRARLRRAGLAWFVRRGAVAANRRDFDFLFLGFDPDVEFRFSGGLIPPDLVGWHHGHAGYRQVWQAGLDAWDDLRLDFDEAVDFGDRILLCGRQSGHGRASGALVSTPVFQVYTLRRGLVVRQEDFTERDEALSAARSALHHQGRRRRRAQ